MAGGEASKTARPGGQMVRRRGSWTLGRRRKRSQQPVSSVKELTSRWTEGHTLF